jgi:hypothetical protein
MVHISLNLDPVLLHEVGGAGQVRFFWLRAYSWLPRAALAAR